MTDLAITILTGNRPRLLRRTIDSLRKQAGDILATAHVTCLVNGDDAATMSIVNGTKEIDDLLVSEETPILSIGSAVSRLMARVPSAVRYVLHLEDDWECTSAGFCERARFILERNAKVGQVRMRLHVSQAVPSQAVSRYHLVTGRLIKWTDLRTPLGWRYLEGDGHLTFNPSLVRRDLLPSIYPCEGERDAARKFLATGHRCAQLVPGAFRHIGGEDSLRQRLGRVT